MPRFADLTPQPPLNPLADAYGEECLRLSQSVALSTRCHLDIAYGSEPSQRLDIYLPDDKSALDLPVMIFFHGGGFTHGYKEWCGLTAPPLTAHPAIVVAPNYRLEKDAPYPAALEDAVAAVAWVHEHIGKYGGARHRIFVGGHSAGGILAAATSLDHRRLRRHGLRPDAIKAVCPISGTYSRRYKTGQNAQIVPSGAILEEENSPLTLTQFASAPFFVTWGGRERQLERVERGSMLLVSRVRDAGQPAAWYVDAQADHFSIHLNTARSGNVWAETVRRWFDRLPSDVMAREP